MVVKIVATGIQGLKQLAHFPLYSKHILDSRVPFTVVCDVYLEGMDIGGLKESRSCYWLSGDTYALNSSSRLMDFAPTVGQLTKFMCTLVCNHPPGSGQAINNCSPRRKTHFSLPSEQLLGIPPQQGMGPLSPSWSHIGIFNRLDLVQILFW